MDERSKWTQEQLEILELLRSKDEAGTDPALMSAAKAVEDCPELAQRLERIQGWDARILEAMQDVPRPLVWPNRSCRASNPLATSRFRHLLLAKQGIGVGDGWQSARGSDWRLSC